MAYLKVLDLFCGIGGLASGFSKAGFSVEGADICPFVEKIFALNKIGSATAADLSRTIIKGKFDIIIGGPPCKPWSLVNVMKRRKKHQNYPLLGRFFRHIRYHEPHLFLMENVPPVMKDISIGIPELKKRGYSISSQVIRYSDFGAPTTRRRLIMVGTKGKDAQHFFIGLARYKARAKTVRQAIAPLANKGYGDVPDHIYPELRTIHKYRKYYKTGKYGWYILDWNKPAPSFGNVMKTYILHPSSWNGTRPRVISIREALLLMGFDKDFAFPEGMGMLLRYQMAADAVSPIFAYAAACVIRKMVKVK